MAAIFNLLLTSLCLLQWRGGIAFTPAVKDAEILSSNECLDTESSPQDDEDLFQILNELPPPGCDYPLTCSDIHRCNPTASSDYYLIQAGNGSTVRVYCDMVGARCGGEGGWMRVAHLNMTDSSSQCPDGFRVETVNSVRFCIRNTSSAGCGSILFETHGLTYSEVCGFVRGYAYFKPDGFINCTTENILCVDGIIITYGAALSHLWTYVANYQESGPFSCFNTTQQDCAGANTEFFYTNYYCESGATVIREDWYTDDPLWDGEGCGKEGACCVGNGQPWFHTPIPAPTIADIQARVCTDENASDENIGVERVELYVR